MTLRLARLSAALPLLLVAGLLSGCASVVAMTAAPDSNSVGCANISVRLPDTVAGRAKRETDAQATGAWGNPAVVLLRCGVPPIGPTTKPCLTANGIDWVLENDPLSPALRYITFGRVPATEVVIEHGKNGVSDASVMADLSDAIGSVKQTQKCISAADVPAPTNAPAAVPTP
ncbi:MAG: DUF3515 family protein [Microbacteriaceae bacterium]|nr:MAG: DUF3515 family protein [Microbacteriaceae bacterium]